MIKNYFKTAWRSITSDKVYSLINILGLTIGLCACMLVATVVIDDLSYDRQWSKGNNLYRIISINKMGDDLYDRSAYSFAGLLPALKNNFPEVEVAAGISTSKSRFMLNAQDANSIETGTLTADTSFWQILDMQVLSGNPRNYINGSNNIVITESYQKKFFAKENPVGKIIYEQSSFSDKPTSYIITGVVKDIPSNSVLRAEVIIPQKPRNEEMNKKEYGTYAQNFILLKPGTGVAQFTAKINKWYAGFVESKNPRQYSFQPVKDIYLHSGFSASQSVKGSYRNIYIFSGVAVLLLLIACVNFINLSTARALKKLRETGVRKILGAVRRQLVFQFLAESFLFFTLAAIFATVLYRVFLPVMQNFLEHNLQQTFTSTAALFAAGYGTMLLISVLTGIYPAWLMSGFKPAATLKGELFATNFGGQNFIRRMLVVVQFSISIAVLIVLIIVQQQVSFMKNKDIGYNKNNLLSINSISWDGKGESFKNELLNRQGVESASITSWLPTMGAGYMSREIDHPDNTGNKLNVWYINGDIDLAKTLGLNLLNGRFLNNSYGTDTKSQDSLMEMDSLQYVNTVKLQSSLITAYTAKVLHQNNVNGPIKNALTSPVGIVKDFNNESLKEPMKPVIIIAEKSPQYGGMLIRIRPGFEQQVSASVNQLWQQFYPGKYLEIKWVDDMLAAQYKEESRLQELFTFFSGLSMFLAALGIFGLVIQATARRKKEIGIRKVIGASVASIVQLISIDFLKLIFIAILIASPFAWWLMNKWLQDFAYHISIQWWMFILGGAMAIITAVITISFQSIKAALMNPVKSLKSE